MLDEHAIKGGAVPLLIAIMSHSQHVTVLERAVRCLANLVFGSRAIYDLVVRSDVLAVVLQLYRRAAPAPVPAKTGKIAKSAVAVNNRQLLCNISALLVAFDTHRQPDAKLSLPLDFVKAMLPNWMTTVASTKNPETLSNLLTVIFGNMQHHEIANHLLSKLDFAGRLVTIVSDRFPISFFRAPPLPPPPLCASYFLCDVGDPGACVCVCVCVWGGRCGA